MIHSNYRFVTLTIKLVVTLLWAASYSDNSETHITQIILDPGESKRVFLDVTVEGEEDADSVTILSRVAIFGTSEKVEQTISVIVSNYDYGMAITPEMPGSIAGQMDIVLPPGAPKKSISGLRILGNFPGGDSAVISMTGMESSVLRRVLVNGVTVDGNIAVPSGDRVLITIELEVLEGVSSGTTGIVKVSASSKRTPLKALAWT